jgi:hypothetical protein
MSKQKVSLAQICHFSDDPANEFDPYCIDTAACVSTEQ